MMVRVLVGRIRDISFHGGFFCAISSTTLLGALSGLLFRRKLHSDGGMQRAFLGNHGVFCMGIFNCGKKKRKKRKNSGI
jgi:hypothetical protein